MESFFTEKTLGHFPHLMIYAFLEWIMIILLFIDGLLAFVSNEFAKFFGLPIPCLLCTRIDHILVHRKSNFYYNDSICETHKRDVSSLAYCHTHKKLSDIRTMCQGCLVPFADDCDKYKSIVGILHKDIDRLVDGDEKIPWCSCCGEPVQLKSSMKYLRNLSMKSPAPSPRVSWLSADGGHAMETPRTRYADLKFGIGAESESEFPQDDVLNVLYNQGREDIKGATTQLLQESDQDIINEDGGGRTPSYLRGGNKYFDQESSSPRRGGYIRRTPPERGDFDPNDVDSDILNHLKKQVRLDHKSLMAMYMELDKERSAAAVAANNAMAMITRIQAEKAAVQMEALQYQRMMEEQAEYDEEAIQMMRDMLVKKDEDIKALESELEIYRDKYGPIINVGSDICEVDADEDFPDEIRSENDDSSCEIEHQKTIDHPFDFES